MKIVINKEDSNKSGIYIIKSLIDSRFYIGSAKKLRTRYCNHKNSLLKGNNNSIRLQNFSNKYGIDKLSFELLEFCSIFDLIEREQFYIDTLKPIFNICLKAGNTLGRKCSEETKKKISSANKGRVVLNRVISEEQKQRLINRNKSIEQRSRISLKNSIPVACYNLEGKFIRTFKSYTEAANELKLNITDISACCISKKIRRVKNFQFRSYKDDNSNIEAYKPFHLNLVKSLHS